MLRNLALVSQQWKRKNTALMKHILVVKGKSHNLNNKEIHRNQIVIRHCEGNKTGIGGGGGGGGC